MKKILALVIIAISLYASFQLGVWSSIKSAQLISQSDEGYVIKHCDRYDYYRF